MRLGVPWAQVAVHLDALSQSNSEQLEMGKEHSLQPGIKLVTEISSPVCVSSGYKSRSMYEQ